MRRSDLRGDALGIRRGSHPSSDFKTEHAMQQRKVIRNGLSLETCSTFPSAAADRAGAARTKKNRGLGLTVLASVLLVAGCGSGYEPGYEPGDETSFEDESS